VTLFLDTSALVKLLVEEEHSRTVRDAAEASSVLVASHLALVETHATLTRMRRGGRVDADAAERLAAGFEELWVDVAVVPIVDRVVVRAAALARRHGLRGYDAMQLAAALDVRDLPALRFASFDVELDAAAAREGLMLLTR